MLDPTARRFLQAAEQRFTASEALLRAGFFLESMYLAGYVAECAIKALIVARTPPKGRAAKVKREFRGRRGHDFESLKAVFDKTRSSIPVSVAHSFRHISTWSTDLRYTVSRKKESEARAYLEAAAVILEWSKRSL